MMWMMMAAMLMKENWCNLKIQVNLLQRVRCIQLHLVWNVPGVYHVSGVPRPPATCLKTANDGRPVDAVRNLDGNGDNWRKHLSISMEICETNVLYMWKPFNLLLDGKKRRNALLMYERTKDVISVHHGISRRTLKAKFFLCHHSL